jgi:hypothetical protein
MVPVFRRLYEACMEKGLPIGCAPNVHVSLVMLPEECRGLSTRRFPWQTLKLKAMAGGLPPRLRAAAGAARRARRGVARQPLPPRGVGVRAS